MGSLGPGVLAHHSVVSQTQRGLADPQSGTVILSLVTACEHLKKLLVHIADPRHIVVLSLDSLVVCLAMVRVILAFQSFTRTRCTGALSIALCSTHMSILAMWTIAASYCTFIFFF